MTQSQQLTLEELRNIVRDFKNSTMPNAPKIVELATSKIVDILSGL